MRKLLLLSVMAFAAAGLNAQLMHVQNKLATMHLEGHSSAIQQNHSNSVHGNHLKSGRSLASAGRLHSERIGSAGNLLTIIQGTCNQLDVNDSLNAVVFVHR